jgi:hypothetical protein
MTVADRLTILPGIIHYPLGGIYIDGVPADQNRWLLDEMRINSLQLMGRHEVTVGSGLDFSNLNTRETDTGTEVFNIKGQLLGCNLLGSTGRFRLNDTERDVFAQGKWSPFT